MLLPQLPQKIKLASKVVKVDSKIIISLPKIYAEVVTFVAGSLEAGGLPGSLEIPEVLK